MVGVSFEEGVKIGDFCDLFLRLLLLLCLRLGIGRSRLLYGYIGDLMGRRVVVIQSGDDVSVDEVVLVVQSVVQVDFLDSSWECSHEYFVLECWYSDEIVLIFSKETSLIEFHFRVPITTLYCTIVLSWPKSIDFIVLSERRQVSSSFFDYNV